MEKYIKNDWKSNCKTVYTITNDVGRIVYKEYEDNDIDFYDYDGEEIDGREVYIGHDNCKEWYCKNCKKLHNECEFHCKYCKNCIYINHHNMCPHIKKIKCEFHIPPNKKYIQNYTHDHFYDDINNRIFNNFKYNYNTDDNCKTFTYDTCIECYALFILQRWFKRIKKKLNN